MKDMVREESEISQNEDGNSVDSLNNYNVSRWKRNKSQSEEIHVQNI